MGNIYFLKMERIKIYRPKNILMTILLIIIPVSLMFLPAGFFDEGQSMCLSVIIIIDECYGCGMTRAIMHLIHGDFFTAWNYNSLSFLVLPLLLILYVKLLALYALNKNIIKWF